MGVVAAATVLKSKASVCRKRFTVLLERLFSVAPSNSVKWNQRILRQTVWNANQPLTCAVLNSENTNEDGAETDQVLWANQNTCYSCAGFAIRVLAELKLDMSKSVRMLRKSGYRYCAVKFLVHCGAFR